MVNYREYLLKPENLSNKKKLHVVYTKFKKEI